MLLDMVMLSSGMRASFRNMLVSSGFEVRIAPKGTLPFDTDATIPNAGGIARALDTDPDITAVSPVLGGQLHVTIGQRTITATALGGLGRVQGDYAVMEGRIPAAADEAVASAEFLRASGVAIGDTIHAAAGYDPELRTTTGGRALRIVGRAHFLYLPSEQRAIALPLATLQTMQGPRVADRVSLFMLKTRTGADVDSVLHRLQRTLPNVSIISTASAMQQVDQRLSYFRQLALILGAVSLAVGFLLVTTIVTVSVNERLGEIVIMRAIGVARERVVLQIVLEGVAIMVAGAIVGLGLGLVTARYLNSILASFPGLPAAIDFFLFEPRDAWTALGLLTGVGILAGIYPSWRGASLPIAITLREEAVG
jgi:ABC-type lipoprotein release transport system permease subunit